MGRRNYGFLAGLTRQGSSVLVGDAQEVFSFMVAEVFAMVLGRRTRIWSSRLFSQRPTSQARAASFALGAVVQERQMTVRYMVKHVLT